MCWENFGSTGNNKALKKKKKQGRDDITYKDVMGSTPLSRFLLLNKLVSDYNARLGADREDEQIKTYELVPDATKNIENGQVFVHLSFSSMLYVFWNYCYDTALTG
jgi:hypothetical protein